MSDGDEVRIYKIEITHPQGFGGHEFELTSDDVFRCVNEGCGAYEVVVRDQATGEIAPCPNPVPRADG
jgi:hypothetical protein